MKRISGLVVFSFLACACTAQMTDMPDDPSPPSASFASSESPPAERVGEVEDPLNEAWCAAALAACVIGCDKLFAKDPIDAAACKGICRITYDGCVRLPPNG